MSSQSVTSTSSTLFLVAIFVCFSLSSSRNPNFMQKGSSLSVEDNSDLLISADNTFACGFYSVGENAYCFSIWFTNSKEKTVVWMANRDKPVNGKGSRVSLLRDGAFVLTDVDGSTTWETNTGTTDVQKAELLDNGNLVLMDSSGKILWQSFDFPTDTLLPHQPITRSKKMISRLGRGNYSAGYFNFYFDNDNVLRLMYDGPDTSTLYWPDVDNTVTQNGRTGYNNTRIAVLDDMGRFLSSDSLQFNASDLGFGIKRRLTIDYDGNLRLYSLNNGTGLWTITWEALLQPCLVRGICGRNGICISTPKLPRCSCLPGYEMTDPSNWNAGCKPRFSITCSQSQQLKFVEFQHMNFYGNDINIYSNKTLDWCKKKCKEDCQCQAFNYRLTGEVKCHLKAALFNGCKSSTVKVSTYLKLPLNIEISEYIILNDTNLTCSSRGYKVPVTGFSSTYMARGKKLRWVYLYCFASAVGVIEFIFLASGWWFLFRRHDVLVAVEEGYRALTSQFRTFSYTELKKATKSFKEELGRGASGVVFKGVLADERVIAVKKLGDAYQMEEVFRAEVSTIGKINHMNLVRMWGFCSESKHRLLVYEYVENKSLDKLLFSENFLGWKERFKVALGTAKGLAYLHHECLEWVIHCDVKPENILLDGEFEPKISDFGLSKLFQKGFNNSKFSRIRGTKGYMAPEWASNLPITAKVDVYSYGVVILELVKGIRLSNWVVEDGEDQEAELTRFVRVVKRKIQSEEATWIEDVVDTRLNGQFSRTQIAKMVEIGISCVEEDRNKRPTMDSIVQALMACEDVSRIRTPDNLSVII
ncbi:S-locus lectin protein kinase family protein, putative [Theobroma cacao]|uniref:Receptor-like serine/threonine-protein kinase n=1 Tax=Theobroma cacao TaxID=3641 RepID=A0A061ESM6_THECC|nr:S-locus lectin protein kinase family protein, putative [Theobroma cacao]